jgi:hypothetical protein
MDKSETQRTILAQPYKRTFLSQMVFGHKGEVHFGGGVVEP